MKKTITTLLTLTMAASLAGCGSKPADDASEMHIGMALTNCRRM